MKISVHFSGMICIVRQWTAPADPHVADDRQRHPVMMVGAYGRGVRPEVPIHHPHLVVPAAAILRTTWEPDRIVEAPGGQLAEFDLDGKALDFETAATGGVSVRDRLRPAAGSPTVNPNDDNWEDIAWVADYERVLNAAPQWAVDPRKPGAEQDVISFTAALRHGSLTPLEPRSERDRDSTWRFVPQLDEGYVQGFTDAVRWTYSDPRPQIHSQDFAGGPRRTIWLSRDCDLHVSALSRGMPAGEDPNELLHFAGFASLFSNAGSAPVPRRARDGAAGVGEATVEPFFCLLALVNWLTGGGD